MFALLVFIGGTIIAATAKTINDKTPGKESFPLQYLRGTAQAAAMTALAYAGIAAWEHTHIVPLVLLAAHGTFLTYAGKNGTEQVSVGRAAFTLLSIIASAVATPLCFYYAW